MLYVINLLVILHSNVYYYSNMLKRPILAPDDNFIGLFHLIEDFILECFPSLAVNLNVQVK